MTSKELRQKYLKFFEERGHKIIPSAPLVPENDPTTLFTGSGMQPMIPYLLGKAHPEGKKITDSQTCFRSQDIEEVGNNRHTTFFEMLGNWSLGDYFKEKQLPWIFEFLTEIVGLDPQKIYVSVFLGDKKYNLPKDNESADIWKKLFSDKGIRAEDVELDTEEKAGELGMQGGRIFYYGVKKNLWSRFNGFEEIAENEPFGPDSEMFYEFTEIEHDPKYGKYCHPNCDCGRFLEIGNSVFMEYKKLADNRFEPLPNKNVDFGGGLERILATSQNESDIFKIDLFRPLIEELEHKLEVEYTTDNETIKSLRIIADHLKASVFLISDGVEPSNKLQGYTLRRLLRRSAAKAYKIKKDFDSQDFKSLVRIIINIYPNYFKETDVEEIAGKISLEIRKFRATIERGFKEFEKAFDYQEPAMLAANLFLTYGFPLEVSEELFQEKGKTINKKMYDEIITAHKELSRTSSAGMFKGGLAEQSEITTKYHTATHLLHAALRKILGDQVQQKGSNITTERLRFDFSYPEKISQENLQKIEDLVNQKIQENLSVISKTMGKEEALKSGALGFFTEKYGDKVTVYTIGQIDSHPEQTKSHPELVLRYTQDPELAEGVSGSLFSKEICGGPHVKNTKELGTFKIIKEESAGANLRRIYAVLS